MDKITQCLTNILDTKHKNNKSMITVDTGQCIRESESDFLTCCSKLVAMLGRSSSEKSCGEIPSSARSKVNSAMALVVVLLVKYRFLYVVDDRFLARRQSDTKLRKRPKKKEDRDILKSKSYAKKFSLSFLPSLPLRHLPVCDPRWYIYIFNSFQLGGI